MVAKYFSFIGGGHVIIVKLSYFHNISLSILPTLNPDVCGNQGVCLQTLNCAILAMYYTNCLGEIKGYTVKLGNIGNKVTANKMIVKELATDSLTP